ncbi:hypothetical protein FD755_010179 [Muntiacus reevesi]|uniref:Phosphatidate cytidylyltransferase, mitochondrial n=1 Tax=Muntiacus reevesi TaxID=9886 RepID=A0A5N3XXZ0_MUNRE|nr:hypothetical protein FD755_010179 [Muntiacus reevesi]
MAQQALQSSGVAFRKILSHFPEELSLAFAYGSGVYRQAGPSSDQKNLKKNWNHYSFLKLIKYGVISTSVLIKDLLNWNNLYIAGDFRMVVGEDKAKVLNIVKPNMAHFRELYGSILQESPQVVYKAQQGSLEFSRSVMSDSLRPHGLQHVRPPCPSPTRGVYPDACPLSRTDFLWDGLVGSPCSLRDSQESSPTPQQLSHTPLSLSSRGSLVPLHFLPQGWCHLHV